MDDYPNSSEPWQIETPPERKEAETKEKEKATSSIGVIKDVLDWFEKQSSDYASPEVLANITINTPATDIKYAVLLAQKMKTEFEVKARAFRTEFAQYIKEDADEA